MEPTQFSYFLIRLEHFKVRVHYIDENILIKKIHHDHISFVSSKNTKK